MSILRTSLLVLFVLGVCPSAWAAKRPNLVLIMIDDLGWSDLHCQGNERLDTPTLDRLASQGMRFTDAYAAAPVCSPTRAALLTGQAPARLRLTNHISNRDFVPKGAKLLPAETLKHLPLEKVTLAERLKEAGYATAFLGKWHLAGTPRANGLGLQQFYPEHQGFDLNVGGCAHGGPPSYFDPYHIHTLPDRKAGEYLPDRLAQEAIQFIRTRSGQPFFLALWTYTVHWPMQAPEALIKKYEKRLGYGLKDARYGAMIEAMDRAVATVLKEIDDRNLTRDTLVIFTSDNGGFTGVADNRPLRSGKGFLYEGGLRVPLIVRWPGVVKPGTVCHTPVVSMDLFATLLEAAHLKPTPGTPLDGESLMPLLKQTGPLERKALYFHYPNYAWHSQNRLGGVIREGKYKLIERYGDGALELYDLEKDLGEKRNLAARMPEKAAELQKKLRDWLHRTGAAMPHKTE
jgi:arylsulfatase A